MQETESDERTMMFHVEHFARPPMTVEPSGGALSSESARHPFFGTGAAGAPGSRRGKIVGKDNVRLPPLI
ncbi:hypothetical protein [Pyramidobacter porci]